MSYHLFPDFIGECGQRVGFCVLDFLLSVCVEQGLLDINHEGKGHLLIHLFVSHAEHCDAVLVDVVEKELFQLEGLLGLSLNPLHQLHCVLLEVAAVLGVLGKDHVVLLGN